MAAGKTVSCNSPNTNFLGEVIVLPVKAFRIEPDFQVGNGTRHPADGFSISFCRDGDCVLSPTGC